MANYFLVKLYTFAAEQLKEYDVHSACKILYYCLLMKH